MYTSAKHLNGFWINSKSDPLGKLTDLYFDDQSWSIRYVVVDTGNWLVGSRVLLSADAIGEADPVDHVVHVTATKQQIEDSPGVDLLKPISPREMEEIHKHYGWPAFQIFPALSPLVPLAFMTPPSTYNTPDTEDLCEEITGEVSTGEAAKYCFTPKASADAAKHDVHLRSTNEVEGYHIVAQDGSLGHVQDFLVDETGWTIRYVVVDTKNWIPGRIVLLPPAYVAQVDWQGSVLRVNLTREQVQNSPEYAHSASLSPEYEQKLQEYYGSIKA